MHNRMYEHVFNTVQIVASQWPCAPAGDQDQEYVLPHGNKNPPFFSHHHCLPYHQLLGVFYLFMGDGRAFSPCEGPFFLMGLAPLQIFLRAPMSVICKLYDLCNLSWFTRLKSIGMQLLIYLILTSIAVVTC